MPVEQDALSHACLVCGLPLSGAFGSVLGWFGIGRSSRNPNCCTRCNTHIEEGRLVEITMLFADLSSFTEMTHKLGADPTYNLVDQYLRLAAGVLTDRGAFIDKYIGDAVMAFFNVPVKQQDHPRAAVVAARELQEKLPSLSERLGMRLQASIGIATGFARVGRLGSDDVKDYTAIGDVVNQAARLQAQARSGEILVSQSVYQSVAADYPDVNQESLTLKGFGEPVAAYRLSGPRPAASDGPKEALGRRPLGAWALLMALLGAGCLGSPILGALALWLGLGSAAALVAAIRWLDLSPLRLPLLIAAAIAALASLSALAQDDRVRREYQALHACVIATPKEKRHNLAIAGISFAALVFAGLELVMHRLHYHHF